MVLKEESKTSPIKTRSKRMKLKEICCDDRWLELPDDLLRTILERLNLVEFYAFGGVCRRWRSFSNLFKDAYLKSIPPFAIIRTTFAKRSCLLQDIFSQRMYKTRLPDFSRKFWLCISSGYIIMLNKSGSKIIFLLNPFTRESHSFFYPFVLIDKILVVPLESRRFILVANSRYDKSIVLYLTKDDVYARSYKDEPWEITDLACFRGRIFVLDNHGRLGFIKKCYGPEFYDIELSMFTLPYKLHLVTTEDRLMIVDSSLTYKVYELDFATMRWKEIDNLGDLAIFLSDGCVAVRNAIEWGGQSNCIYKLNVGKISIFSLESKRTKSYSIAEKGYKGDLRIAKSFWCLPNNSNDVNSLEED